jgi:hypothetical protein
MYNRIIRLFVLQVGREGDIQPLTIRPLPVNQFSIVHERELLPHDPYGLVKCCESLAFLIRDVAHITPYNFENCVHCIRTFVEASLNGSKYHIVIFTFDAPLCLCILQGSLHSLLTQLFIMFYQRVMRPHVTTTKWPLKYIKGTNRQHPLSTNAILLSHYLSCSLLILTFNSDIYIYIYIYIKKLQYIYIYIYIYIL